MKLWFVQYYDDNSTSGWVRYWASSKGACVAKSSVLRDDPPEGFQLQPLQSVDVPTKRRDLVDFLNRYADIG